jgi:small subunit ribosomal protein S18
MKNKKQTQLKVIDYKDIDTLARFINPNARILARRKTGVTASQQRDIAQAIKRARYMGLLPYVAR